MTRKVLLVDDTRVSLELWRAVLTRPSLELFTASNGAEALALHQAHQMNLIVTDLNMPVMDGLQLTRAVRADPALKAVSIIMVSMSAKQEDKDRCLEAGANAYLVKPVKPSELLHTVNGLVEVPLRRDVRVLARMELRGETERTVLGSTVDISVGGLLAELDVALTPGSPITCKFFLPRTKTEVTVAGEVVRVAAPEGATPRYGIRFSDVDKTTRDIIEAFVKGQRPAG